MECLLLGNLESQHHQVFVLFIEPKPPEMSRLWPQFGWFCEGFMAGRRRNGDINACGMLTVCVFAEFGEFRMSSG